MASRLLLLSDEQILKVAAFDISNTLDLHDPRFGSTGSMQFECPTCGMHEDSCVGHTASLRLGCKIFHPLIYKSAENIINRTCLRCYAKVTIPNASQLPTQNAKRVTCMQCGEPLHRKYVIKTYKQLKEAKEHPHAAVRVQKGHDNVYLYPEQAAAILPAGYVVSFVLVPPVHIRTPEDVEWSSDMQKLYEQLVKYLRKHDSVNPGEISVLYSKIIGSTNSEGVIGLMSKKEGICRKTMLGKRMESSARSVIAPDPYIALDEVAVPKVIADEINIPVKVTDYNISKLRQLAADGKLWWNVSRLLVKPRNVVRGTRFFRAPENGDFVMFNRQPSLSRESMMCFTVVLRHDNYSTIGMNPQVVAPFNADFDGDEMNIFFMDKTADMLMLCHIYENFAKFAPVQDVVTGCYMMSKKDEPVDISVWQDCMMHISYPQVVPSPVRGEPTTHAILSACIPGYNGEQLTKQSLKTLIAQWAEAYELPRLQTLQKVVLAWLATKGLTVSIKSIAVDPSLIPPESFSDFRNECLSIVKEKLGDEQIMDIINSGAKGSIAHASNMAVALGQQYILGKPGVFCKNSYSTGLTPKEFFGHQMAAREGVVSTGVSTASTGYLNRRICTIIADVIGDHAGSIGDGYCISTFPSRPTQA